MTQPALVQTRIAVHNLHGPDKNTGRRHTSIELFLNAAKGGLGGFNELSSKDRAFIKAAAAQRGLNVSIVGLNGMVWDPTKFSVSAPRTKLIMRGGRLGADGTTAGPDNRRLGPNRYGIYWDVIVLAIDLDFEFDGTHLMARAFSVHKWRQKLYWRSVSALADGVLEENGIMWGDFNRTPTVDLPGISEVNVRVPADMGRQVYTKILRWGRHIFIDQVHDTNTPSDHDLIVGLVTFYRLPQAHLGPAQIIPDNAVTPKPQPPKPRLPRPGQAGVNWRKLGAPVKHPWVNRSAKFKKRRKPLWHRIQRWQAAYKRRL